MSLQSRSQSFREKLKCDSVKYCVETLLENEECDLVIENPRLEDGCEMYVRSWGDVRCVSERHRNGVVDSVVREWRSASDIKEFCDCVYQTLVEDDIVVIPRYVVFEFVECDRDVELFIESVKNVYEFYCDECETGVRDEMFAGWDEWSDAKRYHFCGSDYSGDGEFPWRLYQSLKERDDVLYP